MVRRASNAADPQNDVEPNLSTEKSHDVKVGRGGIVVRASDLQPIGLRFESRPLRFTNDPGRVVHTHVPLVTKH